jgi:SMODS-associating 2TM, beta-strand rich effector domain
VSSSPNRPQLGALALVSASAIAAGVYFGGPPGTFSDYLRLASAAVTSVTITVALFHYFAWRWLPRFLSPRPVISGTWRVLGKPRTVAGAAGTHFHAFMFVEQKYFSVSMRLVTEHSESELVSHEFNLTEGDVFEIWAIYLAEPREAIDPARIRAHYGAVRLKLGSLKHVPVISGRYWIDGEYTNFHGEKVLGGELTFTTRIPTNCKTFEEATRAYAALR